MKDIYLGAYWGPRQASLEECARRVQMYLKSISKCAPQLSRWYETGWSRKEALSKEVDYNSAAKIAKLLQASTKHAASQTAAEELGFSECLWNGDDDARSIGLSISCGVTRPFVRNRTVITFPENIGLLADCDRMLKVLKTAIEIWNPDWAGVMSHTMRDRRPREPGDPVVGWMIYVRGLEPDDSALPESAFIEQINGDGWIVVVQREPIDADNPEHVRNVEAVEEALNLRG